MNPLTRFSVPWPAGYGPAHQARWHLVATRILLLEGGHSAHAADKGGETNYGISLRFLKAIGGIDANRDGFGDLDLNLDTQLDGLDIRALTPAIAKAIYCKHFWIAPGFWSLPKPFDLALFDQGVNGGTTAAIRLLQRALNSFGKPYLVEDGADGPKTRARLKECLAYDFPVLGAYRTAAANRYRAIALADPTQRRWLNGWLRRASELGVLNLSE